MTYEKLKSERFSDTILDPLKNVTRIEGEIYAHFVNKSNEISSVVKLESGGVSTPT